MVVECAGARALSGEAARFAGAVRAVLNVRGLPEGSRERRAAEGKARTAIRNAAGLRFRAFGGLSPAELKRFAGVARQVSMAADRAGREGQEKTAGGSSAGWVPVPG